MLEIQFAQYNFALCSSRNCQKIIYMPIICQILCITTIINWSWNRVWSCILSKWLINELLKLAFSIWCSEASRFKKSVVGNQPVGNSVISAYPARPAITCSKLTIESSRTRCEIRSKLTIKIPERRHWRRFGIFIVNCEPISHLVLLFLLLTLSR